MWDALETSLRQAGGQTLGVDRKRKIIFGCAVAETGLFVTDGRGQFDEESLNRIVRLMRAMPNGTPSYFTHQQPGGDSLGTFLGRFHNARIDGRRVRADLHLDESAFLSPRGNLGEYVLTLAAGDPEALGLSLVLYADKLPARGAPLWRPLEIASCDVVGFADSVHHGLFPLSTQPRDALLRHAEHMAEALSVPVWVRPFSTS